MASFLWYDADGNLFDLTDSRLILQNYDLGATQGNEQTTKSPFQQGETPICVLLDPRTVTLQYFAECDTPAEAAQLMEDINVAFNPLPGVGYLYFTRDDAETFRLNCRVIRGFPNFPNAYPRMFIKSGKSWFTLQLQLRAADPYWYSGSSHLEYFFATVPPLFPFSFPWSLGSGTPSAIITNAGNANTPVRIIINNQNTDLVITNVTTGEAITLDLAMVDGDRFEIYTGFGQQTVIFTPSGGAPVNGFPYIVGSATTFWHLQPGENQIVCTFTAPSATARATVIWSDKYVGI